MKILVIRFSSLGDIILTFPVIKNIKLNNKNVEIYYLTKKQFASIVKKNKDISFVFEFSSLLDTIRILRKYYFDVAIDLHSNLRSFIFMRLLNAGKKLKYVKDSLYRRLFVNFRILSPKLEKHVIERYLGVLNQIGFKVMDDTLDAKNIDFSNEFIKLPKKIVIIQTSFVGDLVLTLPLLKQIKSQIKDSHISILVRKDIAMVVEGVNEIDEIICDEKKDRPFVSEFFRIVKILKSKKFDIAIIPHRSLRSALIAFFSGIKTRIGFDLKPSALFYTYKIPFKWLMHDVERNFMLLSPLFKEKNIEFPDIAKSFNDKFHNILAIKPLIMINPSSVWETKRWPDYKFALLIEKLNFIYKVPIVITGSEKEKAYIKDIESMVLPEMCINISGQTNLDELIWIIKQADVIITNDSGPMHIAAALGVGVVGIFGPTTRELGFFPYTKKSVVLEKEISCRPCRLHGSQKCPRSHFLCMKLIKVEDAVKAVQKILKYNYE